MLPNTVFEYFVAVVINSFIGDILEFIVPFFENFLNFVFFDEEHILG